MRDDRDRQMSQVQTLSTEIVKFKDSTEKSGSELNKMTMIKNELEVRLYRVSLFSKYHILLLLLRRETTTFLHRKNVLCKITR